MHALSSITETDWRFKKMKRIMQEYEKLVKKAREDIDRIIQQEATK